MCATVVTVSLEQEVYSVDEGSGVIEVCANLTGRTDRNVTAILFTEDGSAVSEFSTFSDPGSGSSGSGIDIMLSGKNHIYSIMYCD